MPTPEQCTHQEILNTINGLSPDITTEVHAFAAVLRKSIQDKELERRGVGLLALALVGAEIAC